MEGNNGSPVARVWLQNICQRQVAPYEIIYFRLRGSCLSFGRTAFYITAQQDADIHTMEGVWSALTQADEKWFI